MFVLFLSDYNEAEISRLLLNICINPESSDSNALMGCQKEEALSIIRFASVVGAHCVGISFNLGKGIIIILNGLKNF
jgi:hypothetical protein